MIYISWYDPIEGIRKNKSTKLKNTKANFRKAQQIAKLLQTSMNEEKEKLHSLGIKRKTIETAFEHFLRNNSDKHLKTIKDYHRFYNKFTEYFHADNLCTTLTKLSIENWLLEIKKLPLQKNSIFGYYKQLNHFLNFLFEYNYIPMFKINRDIKPKSEIKEKITFDKEDIKKIFQGLKDKNSNFKTLIYLAMYTGLRSSDLLTISGNKIKLKERTFSYYSPKRKRFRKVAFHMELIPILKERIKEVGENRLLDYHNVENLGRAITRYFDQIGIGNKGYTARTFRKSFITYARAFKMDPTIVEELVGHEHKTTADRYYNNISIKQMIDELRKFKIIKQN